MKISAAVWVAAASFAPSQAFASGLDEFKIKRQETFEFTERPRITRQGDRVEIFFASKGFCDATVAIEDDRGRIVRHLACGVLGPRAPEPFQKNSLAQEVVWNGKDDQGQYLDDKDSLRVRVSLGLKAQYEKSLFEEPKKRHSPDPVLIQAAPEGVYVFDGKGVDFVRLYDHEGNYVRTVYPFPADKLSQVQGLTWHEFPQDGQRLPLKLGFFQSTFLTSGYTALLTSKSAHPSKWLHGTGRCYGCFLNNAATAMAVRNGRMALAQFYLNRLATDGSTSGLPLTGPKTSVSIASMGVGLRDGITSEVVPRSAALSPDGKWLYLTGYIFAKRNPGVKDIVMTTGWDCFHGVLKLAMEGEAPPEVFAGSMKPDACGSDNSHFKVPASVAVDAQGRVYVADYMNNRIQVFQASGAYIRSIPVTKPASIAIHPGTSEVHVFSWMIFNQFLAMGESVKPALTRIGPLEKPQTIATCALPMGGGEKMSLWYGGCGVPYTTAWDPWADPPTLWVAGERAIINADSLVKLEETPPNIAIFVLKDGKWAVKRDFAAEVKRSVARSAPAVFSRQRLYVNPKTAKLYVAEGQHIWYKSFHDILELQPDTGNIKIVPVPFDAEDMAFDLDGLIYLRSRDTLARYDPEGWREVPFDYGVERERVSTSGESVAPKARVISGLPLYRSTWLSGGLALSPKGHIAIAVNPTKGDVVLHVASRTDERQVFQPKDYAPILYPGRFRYGEIHVFDKHGKLLHEDAVGGLADFYGLGIDKDEHLYLMASPTRVLDGKAYFNEMTGTMMKFKPQGGKLICSSSDPHVPIPLPKDARPGRSPDLFRPWMEEIWVEGAEWMYGGVGFMGRNARVGGDMCACWNCRFTLDAFARSFAPEVDHYSVAVLDSNGNLILRIGRYGNADSAGPKSRVPLGGDEVGFFLPNYLATHTDRRLFIADAGNARIVSVRLEYYASESLPLKGLPDTRAGSR